MSSGSPRETTGSITAKQFQGAIRVGYGKHFAEYAFLSRVLAAQSCGQTLIYDLVRAGSDERSISFKPNP